jgi:hypothetical protein
MAPHSNLPFCNDPLHTCGGTVLDDGQSCVTMCGKAAEPSDARPTSDVTRQRSFCTMVGERIRSSRILAWGPPELISSSLPRSLQ